MNRSRAGRTVALAVAAASLVAVPSATAAAKKSHDLKVMTRNVYLGADIIPLASALSEQEFEQNAASRYQTVLRNDFATRGKAIAKEIAKTKPDLVGLQEAAIWRTGPKDGATTRANDVAYDSTEVILKNLSSLGVRYRVARGRDWFDFEGPTTDRDVRLTQRDVILVRVGSKVKIRSSFARGYRNHFDVPTQAGLARELRGWVGVNATLAKRKFRFATTHLEAYSADIAEKQMTELLAGPLASKKTRSIVVGDFNSAPGANSNDRGASRDASAYYDAIDAGFRNLLPKRYTCCFAEDLHDTSDRLDTWIDHVLVRTKVGYRRSGLVGGRQVGGLYPSDHAGIWATLRLK